MDAQQPLSPARVARSREEILAGVLMALVLASALWLGYGEWLWSGGADDVF
jgi:hypothetical protein